VNYVGGHGVHLPITARPNDLRPEYFGAAGDTSQVTYLQEQVSNPFYNAASSLAPGSLLRNQTVQRAQLLADFPQYTSGSIGGIQNWSAYISYLDEGAATYNALQANLLIHGQGGLTGSVSYVFSKQIGNVSDLTNGFLNATGNPSIQNYHLLHEQEHSLLATDTPHRFTGTVSLPIPVGTGKRFAGSLPRWANSVVGGWSVNTIVLVNSGYRRLTAHFRSHQKAARRQWTDAGLSQPCGFHPARAIPAWKCAPLDWARTWAPFLPG
jgi:hypothetical protein